MRAIVGRMDRNVPVDLTPGMTVLQALASAGFHPAENEVIQDVNHNQYEGNETAVSGLAYFLVERVKSGCGY